MTPRTNGALYGKFTEPHRCKGILSERKQVTVAKMSDVTEETKSHDTRQ
jgi:hypothetical protein